MNVFWDLAAPGTLFLVAGLSVRWAKNLKFFSHAARDLDKVDIPNEVKEVRINELEMLISDEADWYFKHAWKLTRWQRRQAVTRRMQEARNLLHLVISNAALFQEVARFHIRAADSGESEPASNDRDFAFRLMDRAATVHFVAATCMAKLLLVDVCRILWPTYVPALADHFQVRGHDLIAWYRHLAKEMLELAEKCYDEITYTRFIFQLTGGFTVEDASTLNRL